MRRARIADLVALAETLAVVPMGLWPQAVDHLLARADLADRYRKRFGRRHHFGDGTLSAAIDPAWPRGAAGCSVDMARVTIALSNARAARRIHSSI